MRKQSYRKLLFSLIFLLVGLSVIFLSGCKKNDPETTATVVNMFDGKFERGQIDMYGNEIENSNALRTGFVKVEPNTVYTLSTAQMGTPFTTGNILQFDENKNHVCRSGKYGRIDPVTFVTRENTHYVRWFTDETDDAEKYFSAKQLKAVNYLLEEGTASSQWDKCIENFTVDKPKNSGVQNVLDRLNVFCQTNLVTKGNGMVIGYSNPHKSGKADPYDAIVLKKNSNIIGFPYSSVRKTDSFVGFEVSVDTYLSAINNPASIMYTNNFQSPECYGYSPFIQYVWNPYGNVCSTLIGNAFDLDIRYSTYEWENIECMEKIAADVNNIELCDVLCNVTSNDTSGGHLAIITDILRDEDGNIVYLQITEAGIPVMSRTYLHVNFFKSYYLKEFSVYRYKNIDKVPELDSLYLNNEKEYNPYIALDRGDMSVYRKGDAVEINITNPNIESVEIEAFDNQAQSYKHIKTAKKDLWSLTEINGEEFTVYRFTPQSYGKYRVYCKVNNKISDYLYFISADSGDIEFDFKPSQNSSNINSNELFSIKFSGYQNCTPLYICIENKNYVTRVQRMLSKEEISSGRATISYHLTGDVFVKIYYQNEFGRICSRRIPLNILK